MKKVSTKQRMYFHWGIVVLYMVMIFYLSSQDGTKSHEVSAGLLGYLKVLTVFILGDASDFFSGVGKNYECILRKAAHFTEYLILSLIVYKAMRVSRIKMKNSVIWTLILCVVYAISDEVHQYFVPGRAFAVTDIMIDTAGSIFGLTSVTLVNYLRNRWIKQRKRKEM